METLKRHLPVYGPEGLNELRKVAVRFEEKIYDTATSQVHLMFPFLDREIIIVIDTKTTGLICEISMLLYGYSSIIQKLLFLCCLRGDYLNLNFQN